MKAVFGYNRPDRIVAIDSAAGTLVLVRGEKAIVRFNEVEDVRADPTVLESLRFGTVTLTNLRIAWNSRGDPNGHSISIGLSTITKVSVGNLHTASRSTADSGVFINGTRSIVFHAVFNDVGYKFELKPHPRTFTQSGAAFFDILQIVYRAHDTTRMYRRVRVRSSIVQNGQPILLARETVIDSTQNIGMISAIGAGCALGVFVRTSHRILWFSVANELYNVSLPYVDILGLSLKDMKGSASKLLVFSIPANDNMNEFFSPYQELDKKTLKSKENKGKGLTTCQIATFAFDISKAIPAVPVQEFYQSILLNIQKAQMDPDYGIETKEYEKTSEEFMFRSGEQNAHDTLEKSKPLQDANLPNPQGDEKVLKIVQAVVSRSNFASQYIIESQGTGTGSDEDHKDGLSLSFDRMLGVAFQSFPGKESLEELWQL